MTLTKNVWKASD